MRDKPIKTIGEKEDIVNIQHIIGAMIRIYVARGDENENGDFVPVPGQQPEMYELIGIEYQEFAKGDKKTGRPKGEFRINDLWEIVDRKRGVNG